MSHSPRFARIGFIGLVALVVIAGLSCNLPNSNEGLSEEERQGREAAMLPQDPDIVNVIQREGGLWGYCQNVKDEAPTKESYETMAEVYGGLVLLFGAFDLTPAESIVLIQWTADTCYDNLDFLAPTPTPNVLATSRAELVATSTAHAIELETATAVAEQERLGN